MSSTPKQIFRDQMHFRAFERCFNMEDDYDGAVYRDWAVFRDHGTTERYAAFKLLGLDTLLNFWGYLLGPRTFMEPGFEYEQVGETETTIIVRGGYGALEEKFKDGRDGGRMFAPAVVTPEDWARVKAERFIVGDPRRTIDMTGLQQAVRDNPDMPLGMWIGSFIGMTRLMLTFEGAAYACYDYPEMIDDMVETNTLLMERALDQLLPLFTFDAVSIYENITCKSGPTVPMWVMCEIVAPRMKRVCNRLRAAGIDVISVGSDGDIRPLLPILLDCGVNCLSPYEVNGCVHPGMLLDEYRGALRIIGGVDKLIFRQGREAIDAYLQSIAPYVKRGGFVPHVDYTVGPWQGEGNYLYYLQRKRQVLGC